MTELLPLLTALYAGLAGSAHCVGMCGGIAALAGTGSVRPLAQVPLFNLGRIASYAVAGALGAAVFRALAEQVPFVSLREVITVVSSAVLIALGIYFLSGRRLLGFLEAWGGRFWQRIAPLSRRLLPVRRPHHALALGMLWGWLPCGLVYMMLPVAWATASPLQGAAVMTIFGLGTAPAMVAMGFGGAGLRTHLRRPLIRRLAGAVLIASGLFFLIGPTLVGSDHGTHQHHHAAPSGEF